MKQTIRPARFFAKAEGAPSWRDRLAKFTGVAKPQATAKLEIDDANGETLVFPEIGDVAEIMEGVAVTATDGEHVFTSDNSTFNVTVENGKVTKVVETVEDEGDPVEEPAAEMNAETLEFVEAVASALEANDAFKATAEGRIKKLESDLEAAMGTIKDLKATMSHGAAAEGEGDEGKKEVKVGGKTIDLTKINFKK